MKKFLTVLLVIAVMFTFSFGSAFAAVAIGTFDEGLGKSYFGLAMDLVEKAETINVTQTVEISGTPTVVTYAIDYETIATYEEEVLKAVLDYEKKSAGSGNYIEDVTGLETNILTSDSDGDFVYDVAMELVVAQYAKDEADVLGALTGLNVADYSSEKIGTSLLAKIHAYDADNTAATNLVYADFNGETYQDFVQYLIDKAVKAVKDENTMTDGSTVNDYKTAKGNIALYIAEANETNLKLNSTKDKVEVQDTTTSQLVVEKAYAGADGDDAGTDPDIIGLGVYELNEKLIVADKTIDANIGAKNIVLGDFKATSVEAGNTTDAATIAVEKAAIAQAYANYVTNPARTADEKEFAADLKLVLDTLADEGIFVTTVADYFNPDKAIATTEKISDTVADAIKEVEGLQAYADKMIAEKNAGNTTVRDAADVQDIVDEYTIYAYAIAVDETVAAADYNSYDSETKAKQAMSIIYNDLTAEALAFEKKAVEKDVASLLASFEYDEVYYAPEFAKVKALADEYLAAVNALTEFKTNDSDNFVRLYNKFMADVDNVKTAAEVNVLPGVLALIETAEKYYDLYNDTLRGDNKLFDDTYASDDDDFAKLEKEVKKLVGASEARTKTEIVALGDQLQALVRTLPSIAQVEAADEAAEDAVDAIPTTVKISDRATIEAAQAAVKEYKTLTAVAHDDASAVATAVTKLLYAYNNDFTVKAKAVDKTDKAAVTALVDEIEKVAEDFASANAAYADCVAEYTGDGTYTDGTSGAYPAIFKTVYDKLTGYLDDIQEAAYDATEKAINAIPVNVTASAEPAVKAARAAYDAYVAEYTDYKANLTVRYEARDNDGFVADDFAYAELVRAEAALGLNDKSEEIAKMEAIAAIEGLKIKASSTKGKGYIKVKWTVSEEVEGVKYQVYKSTKAQKGYKKSITTSKTSFKNTKNITKGTRYFYKVRAIGVVDGVTYYSDWSNKANRVAK